MQWSIQHITSSPCFPHGNAHVEKAVHIVKQIYEKVDDIKLALLLLKMMPIANKGGTVYDALATMFFGRQLKAHMPIQHQSQLHVDDDSMVSLANSFAATASTNTRNATFKIVHSDLLI